MRRRGFLIGTASLTALAGCKPWTPPPNRPAHHDPHDLAVIAAIADTFLPGGDGTPGAHEVNATATILDPAYEVSRYIPEVVADLDQWCLTTKLKGFLGLSRRDREFVLEQRMGLRGKLIRSLFHEVYAGILMLTKLAYFGALASPFGTNYLAFPGGSTGYAPGSAAGAWASRDAPWPIVPGARSTIRVEGKGNASRVQLSAFATAGSELRAALRLHSRSGRSHELALQTKEGEGWLIDTGVPLGGPAEGDWRLEVVTHQGNGKLELWSLVLRTDLDDRSKS